MHLLQCLWFFSAYLSIKISVCHIPGILNTDANLLSRNWSVEFLKQNPHVATIPETIPMPLLKLVSPIKQDLDFTFLLERHFKRAINRLKALLTGKHTIMCIAIDCMICYTYVKLYKSIYTYTILAVIKSVICGLFQTSILSKDCKMVGTK